MEVFSRSSAASWAGLGVGSTVSVYPVARCWSPVTNKPSTFSTPLDPFYDPNQALLEAAAAGDTSRLLLSLADGADASKAVDAFGRNALAICAGQGHVGPLDLLIAAGTSLSLPDVEGRCPVFHAVSSGSEDCTQTLLKHGAVLWPCCEPGQVFTRQACQGYPSMQRAHPELVKSARNLPAPSRTTSMALQASLMDSQPIQQKAGQGQDSDSDFVSLRSSCPLCAAAAAGKWPIVAMLLQVLPANWQALPTAIAALQYTLWALASHRTCPPAVLQTLPQVLPPVVVNALRPAHLASTPLVLAAGSGQPELARWLLDRGADPDMGAPLLLCIGPGPTAPPAQMSSTKKFSSRTFNTSSSSSSSSSSSDGRPYSSSSWGTGSLSAVSSASGAAALDHLPASCCLRSLLRAGAKPGVAWADQPQESALSMAARCNAWQTVYQLVTHGAGGGGEAARVRRMLFSPPAWERHLDGLLATHGSLITQADIDACPCGVQHLPFGGNPMPLSMSWMTEVYTRAGAGIAAGSPFASGMQLSGSMRAAGGFNNDNSARLAALSMSSDAAASSQGTECMSTCSFDFASSANPDDSMDDAIEAWLAARASEAVLLEPAEDTACAKAVSDLWEHAQAVAVADVRKAAAAARAVRVAAEEQAKAVADADSTGEQQPKEQAEEQQSPAASTAAAAAPPAAPPGLPPMPTEAAALLFSIAPWEVLGALRTECVAGSWLVAALRCRQQRLARLALYNAAVATGRQRLRARRLLALAALTGRRGSLKRPRTDTPCTQQQQQQQQQQGSKLGSGRDVPMEGSTQSTGPEDAYDAETELGRAAKLPYVFKHAAASLGNAHSHAAAAHRSWDELVPADSHAMEEDQPLPCLTHDLVLEVMVRAGLMPPQPSAHALVCSMSAHMDVFSAGGAEGNMYTGDHP